MTGEERDSEDAAVVTEEEEGDESDSHPTLRRPKGRPRDSSVMLQNSKAANAGSGPAISAQASEVLRAWHAARLLCSSDNGPVRVVVEVTSQTSWRSATR